MHLLIRQVRSSLLSCAAVIATTGCQTNVNTQQPALHPPRSVSDQRLPFTMDALPPQPLRPDGCELFLFTPRPEPRFIFFADVESGRAVISLNGEPLTLTRIQNDHNGFFDPDSMHRFAPKNRQFEIIVSLRPLIHENGPSGGRGAGVLRIAKNDGWVQIAPVSGVSTCGIPQNPDPAL